MIDAARKHDTRLPDSVYELALRLGASPDADPRSVRLTQTGRMKTRLDARSWMPFTATQTIAAHACAFDWLARVGPFGMISARDALAHGEGRLDVKALGFIPLARAAHTPALMRGELMRYLAELPWVPDAILHNAALRWREETPDTLHVSAGINDTVSDVVLTLDSEGRIAGTYAPDRPRSVTAPFLPTPWRGRFSDYRRCHDRWIPFQGEVAWEIDGKEIVYWQGSLTSWELRNDV